MVRRYLRSNLFLLLSVVLLAISLPSRQHGPAVGEHGLAVGPMMLPWGDAPSRVLPFEDRNRTRLFPPTHPLEAPQPPQQLSFLQRNEVHIAYAGLIASYCGIVSFFIQISIWLLSFFRWMGRRMRSPADKQMAQ
jgi:hypothetical protein